MEKAYSNDYLGSYEKFTYLMPVLQPLMLDHQMAHIPWRTYNKYEDDNHVDMSLSCQL